jgi:hypothetical protein
VRHRIDIASARDLPGSNAQTWDIAAAADLVPVMLKMMRLLVTHRGGVGLGFGCARMSRRRGTPGHNGALGCPVVNRTQEHAPHPSFDNERCHPNPE